MKIANILSILYENVVIQQNNSITINEEELYLRAFALASSRKNETIFVPFSSKFKYKNITKCKRGL